MDKLGTANRIAQGDVRLETSRLVLRKPREDDLGDILDIFSDPEVTRYWSGAPWTDMAQAHDWLARIHRGHEEGSGLQLMLQSRDLGRVIGSCTIFDIHYTRRAEIGYVLGRPWWGRGLMNEALQVMVDFAFTTMDLRRLEADIDPDNVPSRRSLERLGFAREGLMRERWEVAGKVSDSEIFGLLRQHWHGPA